MSEVNRIIHEDLYKKFRVLLDDEWSLRNILFQVLAEGTAYLMGGYVRDALEGKDSRDIDIVVDIKKERLKEIVDNDSCTKQFNRFGGVKLKLSSIDVDIWSFDNNWAFKNKLVKMSENEMLNSLAKGCFYNYDALVVNISKFTYSTKFYESFQETRTLDILQKRPEYKMLNPSVDANILRAIYIKKQHDVTFSAHLKEYVYKNMMLLNNIHGGVIKWFNNVRGRYPKYAILNKDDIAQTYEELKNEMPTSLFG